MRSNVQKRAIIDGILITVVAVILISVAPSISAARPVRISHGRSRNVVPTPPSGAVGESSTAEVLQRQNEILAGLEVSQSALERAATDSDIAIRHGINQLKTDFGDSRRESLQMLEAANQRIASIRRWLEFIALLFVLSLGALVYFIVRLVRFQEDSLKWKGDVRAINPAERGTFSWQSEDPANGPDPI
jgi:hypothetical protein